MRHLSPTRPTMHSLQNATLNTSANHIENCTIGAEDWLEQNIESSKDFTIGKLPDSPDNSVDATPTNESDEDDVNHGALIDQADQRELIIAQSWTCGPKGSWQSHWQHFGWGHVQDIRDPSGHHNLRWLPQLWRPFGRNWWAQLTLLVTIMTRTKLRPNATERSSNPRTRKNKNSAHEFDNPDLVNTNRKKLSRAPHIRVCQQIRW